MVPSPSVLVPATLFTIMFALGVGLPLDGFSRWQQQRGLLLRGLLGTCVLVPLAGLALVLMPLYGLLSRPVWVAMALMLACPSAPLILFRVRSSGGTAELAARLQIGAALLAIVTVPLMEVIFRSGAALRGLELVSWGITPSQVAGQVLRVQVLPVLAGVLLGQWQPELARRCSRALGGLATVLLILMLLALLLLSGPQLLPFLQHNLVGLVGMAVLSVLSLAVGYGLAGSDPLERRTVALVTGMRNTGLAAQLALTFGKGLPGLVPGILAYVLITVIVTTLFLKWQQRQLGTTG